MDNKQIRVAILHNGVDSSVEYAKELADQISDECVVADINAKRYLREVLPVRAIPNIMVCLFCEGLEEYQEVADVLGQLSYIKEQNAVASALTDEQAVDFKEIYDIWKVGVDYAVDDRRRYEEELYKCLQAHTSQADWAPDKTPALWAKINKANAGTVEDPIPAARGMEYEYGKYYLDPEDNNIYLCERGSETGTIVLQYLPHEVVGNYFTLVE